MYTLPSLPHFDDSTVDDDDGDLDRIRLVVGIRRLQAVCRGVAARRGFGMIRGENRMRRRIAKEMVETERAYVQGLVVCVECFLGPLREAAKRRATDQEDAVVVDGVLVETVFRGLEDVLSVSKMLLTQFEIYFEQDWVPYRCIGLFMDRFTSQRAFLNAYSTYITNYDESLWALQRLQEESKFARDLIAQQLADPRCKGLGLAAFLIAPVQRVPRYILLLQEFLNHTWEDHPDKGDLARVVKRLAESAARMNEVKRTVEVRLRVMQLKDLIRENGLDVSIISWETFVFEGELFDAVGQQISAFLFTDMLILSIDKLDWTHTEAQQRRQNLRHASLADCRKLNADAVVAELPTPDAHGRPGFDIGFPGERERLRLFCSSKEVRNGWLDKLRRGNATEDLGGALGGAQRTDVAGDLELGYSPVALQPIQARQQQPSRSLHLVRKSAGATDAAAAADASHQQLQQPQKSLVDKLISPLLGRKKPQLRSGVFSRQSSEPHEPSPYSPLRDSNAWAAVEAEQEIAARRRSTSSRIELEVDELDRLIFDSDIEHPPALHIPPPVLNVPSTTTTTTTTDPHRGSKLGISLAAMQSLMPRSPRKSANDWSEEVAVAKSRRETSGGKGSKKGNQKGNSGGDGDGDGDDDNDDDNIDNDDDKDEIKKPPQISLSLLEPHPHIAEQQQQQQQQESSPRRGSWIRPQSPRMEDSSVTSPRLGGRTGRNVSLLSVDDVVQRLLALEVSPAAAEQFRARRVDGTALCELSAETLQADFKLLLSDRLKVRKLVEEARASVWK